MKEFDLFLSHNGVDKTWVEHLATVVEADRNGSLLKVFFDKWDIPPGGDIPLELEQGLQNSRYIGLVLSPEALLSDWVSLERSTAIYSDPRAKQRSLIPLLRRDCEIPSMLARLNMIDFRHNVDFDAGVAKLVAHLRGLPSIRGNTSSPGELHLREDVALFRRQRVIFERPAFETPCIWELFLRELKEAADMTLAALNTGSLYSRDKTLLASFPGRNEYITPQFREVFAAIANLVVKMKRDVVEFEALFMSVVSGYRHHLNFYAMLVSSAGSTSSDNVQSMVDFMDRIDSGRNQILSLLNTLLDPSGGERFSPIELSSEIIRKGQFGGADRIKEALHWS
ncbi:toll/interleukin-1 receptor domain-containing protein [Mesorhizobium loti]|uniref:Toll/interleukin-1 receptor domain-containing protein n=1 Tax=Mesorhizobium loti R88b TaxID=935548 RepID=A0A6M7WL31_RHILI|nr:toll/interleukin-1 receptor domain-containing protein [Mesorhizobium loti]QKD03152.1 toll/interleukin-1 receptor domain-containing protein [Mesorhizobium loti R88b]